MRYLSHQSIVLGVRVDLSLTGSLSLRSLRSLRDDDKPKYRWRLQSIDEYGHRTCHMTARGGFRLFFPLAAQFSRQKLNLIQREKLI